MIELPGPKWIDAGGAPGGFVFRVYDSTNALLVDDPIPAGTTDVVLRSHEAAEEARRQVTFGPLFLVTYDGDSGERVTVVEV